MQLLFNIDADVNIQSKMTAIEQESLSLPEKFTNKEIIEKGNDDRVNVVNENSITNTLDECTSNGNLYDKDHIASNNKSISIKNLDNNENKESNKESSPTANVNTYSQDSHISSEILEEEQNNIDDNINLDYGGDKETKANLKHDVIDLGSRVEKNETNIEIKVDIEVKKEKEVKKGSQEHEQKITPTILSENKEISDSNAGMEISISSICEGTPVTEEIVIFNSANIMHSNDRVDIETNAEFEKNMEICEEAGEINVGEEIDIQNIKENKVEYLHAEMLYKENAKTLEEIMDDSDEISSGDIVFKQKETIDENTSTVEMKSDIELCEPESNLKSSNPIKHKTLEIESMFISCEEVYSELQTTSNLVQSTAISTEVQLRDDVIKIEDEAFKENKGDKKIDITNAIDDVNKEKSLKGEISFDIVEVNKEISEIDINTSLNKINEITIEKESEIKQSKKLEIYFEESAMIKLNENNVKKENIGRKLSKESEELEINVDESTKETSDEKVEVIEVDEPDLLQEEEFSKINDDVTTMNNNVAQEESLMIQNKELEINVVESTEVTSDEKMDVVEVNEPDLLQEKEISKINDDVTKINNNVAQEESLMNQNKKLEINVVESTKVTSDEKMNVIEVNESDLLKEEEISKTNVEVTDMNDIVVERRNTSKSLEINSQNKSAKVTRNKNMEIKEFNDPDYVKDEKVSSANQVLIDVEVKAIEVIEKDEEKSSNFIHDEIIDIADETFDVEIIPENLSDSSNELASNATDIEQNDFECEKTKANKETENRNINLKGKSGTEAEDEKITDEKHVQNVEKKKLSHISKLSNTLDILSDEEEDSEKVSSPIEKDCINIEDDDDIVLIDEGTTKDHCKYVENNENKITESVEHNNTNLKENVAIECESKTGNIVELGIEDVQVTEKELQEQKPLEKELENLMPKIPLLPKTFLKTSKKSLAEMTRDELEEFCVKKIGESVIDRSNLNEIVTQLTIVTTNLEEYKKRVNALMKQNRDLQVIVKSVLEEQKNGSNTPITPLKITRSVGMQVFMNDKPTELKKSSAANSFQSFSPNKVRKRQTNQSLKATKLQTNSNQQIPVPRLVPAVNNASSSANKTAPATPTKIQGGPVPNGVWNSHQIPKPEKRPHSKLQNSVTVDLTDDEPPAKIIQRTVTPPVRLVPQQALLATQRPQFANNNSPKKVYIPIGAAQNQVRAGHTIMLKQVSQGQKIRTPSILPKQSPLRVTRIAPRHPAPLPDSMKQYQPPNWKALPPMPELALSKVKNGIVISWKISDYQQDDHEQIASYQIYAYQETSSPPSTALWKKIGDVKALPLPMACTLTQFMSGFKYYFAVRAIDIRSRLGPFSLPGSILLLNKI